VDGDARPAGTEGAVAAVIGPGSGRLITGLTVTELIAGICATEAEASAAARLKYEKIIRSPAFIEW
jgi:hypothetical protein